jgi:hypothetical protein
VAIDLWHPWICPISNLKIVAERSVKKYYTTYQYKLQDKENEIEKKESRYIPSIVYPIYAISNNLSIRPGKKAIMTTSHSAKKQQKPMPKKPP